MTLWSTSTLLFFLAVHSPRFCHLNAPPAIQDPRDPRTPRPKEDPLLAHRRDRPVRPRGSTAPHACRAAFAPDTARRCLPAWLRNIEQLLDFLSGSSRVAGGGLAPIERAWRLAAEAHDRHPSDETVARLQQLLRPLFLRRTREMVRREIRVPPQSERRYTFALSAAECELQAEFVLPAAIAAWEAEFESLHGRRPKPDEVTAMVLEACGCGPEMLHSQ